MGKLVAGGVADSHERDMMEGSTRGGNSGMAPGLAGELTARPGHEGAGRGIGCQAAPRRARQTQGDMRQAWQ
jgi:hypothetical protein